MPVLALGGQGAQVPAVTTVTAVTHPAAAAGRLRRSVAGRCSRVSRRGGTVWPLEVAVSLRFGVVLLGFVSVLTRERAAHVCAVRLLLRLWGAQLFPLSFPDNPDGQRMLHFYYKILDKIMVFMTDLSIEKGRERYDPSSL